MPQPAQDRHYRRWFQFSLRTLLIATAVVAGFALAYIKIIEPYRLQREAMAAITKLGGTYKTEDATGWVRWLDKTAQDVVVVDLADCDAPDEYLPHLLRLPRLKALVIGGHAVGDEQVAALGRVGSLKGLVLDSTKVSDEGVACLKKELLGVFVYKSEHGAIGELRKLGATFAPQSDEPFALHEPVPPDWLRGEVDDIHFTRMPRLLAVTFNAVDSIRPTDANLSWLGNLKTLGSIDVSRTDIAGDFVADLPPLSSLTNLDFDETAITDATLAHISRFPNLVALSVSVTNISDDGLAHVAAFKQLRWLNVSNTSITDAGLKHLACLPQLEFFFAANTRMGDTGMAIIAHMPSVYRFNIQGTQVSDEGVSHLVRQSRTLTYLSLADTSVSDRSVPVLEKLTQLTDLDIKGTKISPSGMQRLKAALPKCDFRE